MKTKTLANGYTGSGKSHFVITHHKTAWAITEPGTEILLSTHPELAKNVVYHETFLPSPTENVKQVLERLDKFILKAHEDCKTGKVETLALDNLTFYVATYWMYLNMFQPLKTRTGELDTRSMYGVLSRDVYKFLLVKILSFPGNVIVTCHEQYEGEEAMEKKTDKTTPIVPNILGGMREKIGGMFSASIYLDKKRVGEGKYKYLARCQKGNLREAKNRYGLPEIVEDISYQKMIDTIKQGGSK